MIKLFFEKLHELTYQNIAEFRVDLGERDLFSFDEQLDILKESVKLGIKEEIFNKPTSIRIYCTFDIGNKFIKKSELVIEGFINFELKIFIMEQLSTTLNSYRHFVKWCF